MKKITIIKTKQDLNEFIRLYKSKQGLKLNINNCIFQRRKKSIYIN